MPRRADRGHASLPFGEPVAQGASRVAGAGTAPADGGGQELPGNPWLTIAGLYDRVDRALAGALPADQVWVRGEVQSISDRTGHCYMDLVDPADGGGEPGRVPVLKAKCWRTTWAAVRRQLATAGAEITPGTVVLVRGTLDVYRPRGEIGFIVSQVDVTALLGAMAERRRALVEALRAEGLLDRNRSRPEPALPLRVGLVASPGTEGYKDFLGQLDASGYAFRVTVVPATVQGTLAPESVASAIAALGAAVVDVVVVVRGGGARGDLLAFDSEPVARAIATSALPVWTGIGHSGDQSVADLVAQHAHSTPTACGHAVVARVAEAARALGDASRSVLAGATQALERSHRAHVDARRRLAGAARGQLDRGAGAVSGRAIRLASQGRRAVQRAEDRVRQQAARPVPLVRLGLAAAARTVEGRRRLLAAYDVGRQLRRGYTLTYDAAGRVLRSVRQVQVGGSLATRFADGSARSTVAAVDVAPATGGAGGAAAEPGDAGPWPPEEERR